MSNKFNVVVVDDEKLIAKNIAKNIEKLSSNFQVVNIFSNGLDALDFIKENPPHVVFTDIRMPLMDGLELAKEMADINSPAKCVILTGYADFSYAKTAMQNGVVDYLLKPVNAEELEKVLKQLEVSLIAANPDFVIEEDQSKSPEELVELIKEYVHNHYKEPIDLNVLADNMGFSPSYLTKIFTKYEETTPSKYIRNYRMNIAKQMLSLDTNLDKIAEAVGYTDPFHFSKSFKQTFGMSPSEYRKTLN